MASVSPKHDTHPLLVASGVFAVSVLGADQVDTGQYFSYPGRRFRHIATEYLEAWDGLPVVPDALSWLRAEIFERKPMADHDLFFARVTNPPRPPGGPASPLLRPPRLAGHWRQGPGAGHVHPGPSARAPGQGGRGGRPRRGGGPIRLDQDLGGHHSRNLVRPLVPVAE